MSKRSLFWGNGSGKLGEAVFYRAGGEQRTRTYVKNVKNPKSYQQALQRAKFNNMVGAYKALSEAVKSFYTKRNANQSPFNAFFRRNWGVNRWVADKFITNKNEGVMQGFYVADGDIAIDTTLTIQDNSLNPGNSFLALSIPAGGFQVPEPMQAQHEYVVTGQQFYQLLVGDTNPYGLPAEFNVTIVEVSQGNESQGAVTFTIKCSATSQDHFRLVQNQTGRDTPTKEYMDSLVTVLNGEYTEPSSGQPGVYADVTLLGIGQSNASAANLAYGYAVVISFKDPSGKRCTRSVITYGQALADTAGDYTPDAETGMSIISQYEVTSNLIE